MKFRSLTFVLALALAAPGADPLWAQQTLNVRDADIRAFIQDAARVTGRTFIIDNRVQGKVSVVTDRPLSTSEYFEVFLSTLRANALVAVPTSGGAYRIQPVEGAAGQPGRVGRATNANQFVTEVFRLRNIDATTTLETLRPLVSRDGSVTANRAGNSLVVADYADNVARVRQLLARLDRSNDATDVVTLRNASAREIAQTLTGLIGQPQQGGPSATAVAVDSANAVALRGDPAVVARLARVARDLDQRARSGADIRVYWLEHADAEKLLPVLQQLLGQPVTQSGAARGLAPTSSSFLNSGSGGAGGGGTAPATGINPSVAIGTVGGSGIPSGSGAQVGGGNGIVTRGPAVVTRFDGANAIILAANPDVQRQLGDVIRQLDTRRDQVLVEAIVVEISDQAARQLGVQFLLGSTKTGFAATNFSNVQPNLLTLAGAYAATKLNGTTVTTTNGSTTVSTNGANFGTGLQEAAVQSLLNATGGFGGLATRLGANGVLGAIINAVRSDSASNLLSTPSVTTLDNQQASLLVGQQVPVTTGEALSNNFDNRFRTVQRQNVGIQLDVKPQINAGGSIKLALRQEVSSVAGPVTRNSSDLIINKREIQTTVTVDDGEILVLGGLLDENERRTIEKIPLLGDIPGLGVLFRSKARARAKTNLMVFIRPTILRNREDARRLTEQRYGYVRAQQMYAMPEREPSLDTLIRDYMDGIPPGAIPLPPDPAAGAVIVTPPGQPVTVTPPPGQPTVIEVPVTSSTTVIRPVDLPPSRAERPK